MTDAQSFPAETPPAEHTSSADSGRVNGRGRSANGPSPGLGDWSYGVAALWYWQMLPGVHAEIFDRSPGHMTSFGLPWWARGRATKLEAA